MQPREEVVDVGCSVYRLDRRLDECGVYIVCSQERRLEEWVV
jgi:hypothetical protein